MRIRNIYTGVYSCSEGMVKRNLPGKLISVQGHLVNTRSKTIKYATLSFEPLNRVGDPVECEVHHHRTAELKITGPIEPGKQQLFIGEDLWFNPSITSVKVTKIDVIYMDGTTETIGRNDIEQYNLPTAAEMNKDPRGWLSTALIWGVLILLICLFTRML